MKEEDFILLIVEMINKLHNSSSKNKHILNESFFALELILSMAYFLAQISLSIEFYFGKLIGLFCNMRNHSQNNCAELICIITKMFPSFLLSFDSFKYEKDKEYNFEKLAKFYSQFFGSFRVTFAVRLFISLSVPLNKKKNEFNEDNLLLLKDYENYVISPILDMMYFNCNLKEQFIKKWYAESNFKGLRQTTTQSKKRLNYKTSYMNGINIPNIEECKELHNKHRKK